MHVRPENQASQRIPEKLGFRMEGLRPRYLHIDGDWRDHLTYALVAEDAPEGVLSRLIRTDQGMNTILRHDDTTMS